tara:strand:+ start:20809 stop:21372 length:564 start_codon:yes stop_codon:yes gene_type:complete
MMISKALLKTVASPYCKLDLEELAEDLNNFFPRFGITTIQRAAGFISQVAHETGGFTWLTELGGRRYFNKYEPGTKIGKRLGNTIKGDGYAFRGRGLIQLTGRYNYTKFNEWLEDNGYDYDNVVLNPDSVSHLPLALLAALWYWDSRDLNNYCDRDDIKSLTKRINGGFNGYSDRVSKYKKLIQELV